MVGISVFESDSAGSFISDLFTTGYGLLEVALDNILEEDSEPGVIECEEALVAAEFVAAALGNPAFDFPEDAREWMADQLQPGSDEFLQVASLGDKAAEAIDRIVADSELREMWDGSVSYDEWVNNLIELQKRLTGDPES